MSCRHPVVVLLVILAGLSFSAVRGEEPAPLGEPIPLKEWIPDPKAEAESDLIEVIVPPPPPPKLWSGGFEFGLNGAAGNSELFKTRVAGNTKRETPKNIFTSDFLYAYGEANGVRGENHALWNLRDECLFPGTPWSLFVSGTLEYDEFTAWSTRAAAHSGLGYVFVKNDLTLFRTRLGAGASRELGGPENRVVPEALVAFDFEHKFTDRLKATSTVTFYPDLGEIGEFRAVGQAAIEYLIDPTWNLTFKIGCLDRYDSTPEGQKPNDIEYFAVLLWKY